MVNIFLELKMKTKEAIDFYNGSVQDLANALGVTRFAVYRWGKFPPMLRQFQLERITDGKLKPDA